MWEVMFWPLVACLLFPWLLVYLGTHVIQRGIIFIDIAMAQLASAGVSLAVLLHLDIESPLTLLIALAFTLAGAAVFSFTGKRESPVPQEAVIGIAYVVAIVPEKFTIYPEHLPTWITKGSGPTPYDRLAQAMARHPDVAFVDLRPALRAAKARELVYYKTDSHWNYNGAVAGYEALMAAVQKALPGRVAVIAPAPRPPFAPGVDRYRGDLLHMLGRPPGVYEDDVAPLGKVLATGVARCARRIDKGEQPGFESYGCMKPGLPRAVILRDSMAIPLIPLLSENFSRVVYVSARKLDKALVEREKPDIVIEELVERSMHAPGALPME